MKRLIPLLVLTVLLASSGRYGGPLVDAVSGATDDDIDIDDIGTGYLDPNARYKDALRAGTQAGKLVFLVYYNNSVAGAPIRAKRVLLTDNVKLLKKHFVLVEFFIRDTDDQLPRFRKRIEGNTAPFWVVLRPTGEFIDGGDMDSIGEDGEGPWRERVMALIKQYPPISPKLLPTIAKLIKQTRKQLEEGQDINVDRAMLKLRYVWYPPELTEACNELWTTFEARWHDRIAAADVMVAEEQPLNAALAYQAILDELTNRGELGGEVQGKLDALLEDEELKEAFKEAKRTGTTQPAMSDEADDVGDDSEPDGEASDGELVDESDEAAAADDAPDASADDETAQADEVDEAAEREASAKSILQLAKMYLKQELPDKAQIHLKKCVDDYPDTQAAKEAQKLLKELDVPEGRRSLLD